MRTLALLSLLVGSACTCNGEAPSPTLPSVPPITPSRAEGSTETPADTPTPALATPPARPDRGATAIERAARVHALTDDERQRLRARAEHLRTGRRLAHAGDHAGALREFTAGLALEPTDGTLLCEAGLQAHRTGDLVRAGELLARGAAHAVRPATTGACLYNLGRVLEDQDESLRAAEVYAASLRARPNQTVRSRLATLQATLEGEVGEYDEEAGYQADLSTLTPGRTFASAEAFCAQVANFDCWIDEPQWVPTTPSPRLRELRMAWVHSDEDLSDLGYLLVRSDAHWTLGPQLVSADSTDTYGRIELAEVVDEVRFEGDVAVFAISGSADEADGEADLYWGCENERPDDVMACFEEGRADLPAPDTWTRTVRFDAGANRITEE